MGSKLPQDPSSDLFHEDPTCGICKKPANKQTNSHENNTSLVEVMVCQKPKVFRAYCVFQRNKVIKPFVFTYIAYRV